MLIVIVKGECDFLDDIIVVCVYDKVYDLFLFVCWFFCVGGVGKEEEIRVKGEGYYILVLVIGFSLYILCGRLVYISCLNWLDE